jgi:hypothetical protein
MTVTRIPSEIVAVPDFVTMTEPVPDKTMAELAVALVAMFTEDGTLPPPLYLSISESGQEISMQFGTTPDTFHTLAQWAQRFGTTVTGSRDEDIDGKAAVHCQVTFAYAGVQVRAWAYVRASSNR